MTTSLIQPVTVYHIRDGATELNGVDGRAAVAASPREWSFRPWTAELLKEVEARLKRDEENKPVPYGALRPE